MDSLALVDVLHDPAPRVEAVEILSAVEDEVSLVFEGRAEKTLEEFYSDRDVVVPTNEAARHLNNAVYEELPRADEFVSLSVDSAELDAEEAAHYPTEFLNSVDVGGLPPHVLRLRAGTLCMLLRKS